MTQSQQPKTPPPPGPPGPPGPYGLPGELVVTMLAACNPAELDTDIDVLDLVGAWEKIASWVAARQCEAIAEFARRPDVEGAAPEECLRHRMKLGEVARLNPDDELALELGVTSYGTAWRLQVSLELAGRLPETAEALRTGRISLVKARKIVEYTTLLSPEDARTVEAAVLPRAAAATPGQLAERLAKAVVEVDAAAAEARERKRRARRSVRVFPDSDGMACLEADLAAADAATVDAAIAAAARSAKAAGDERTINQLRADMLVAPFREALTTGELAGAGPLATMGGQRAAISVTVPACTLMGLADAPGHLAGYGAITPATARELASEGTWRRLLTDPVSGRVVDVGTQTYRPPAALDRFVRERDGRCQFPGCRRSALRCDLDHVVPYPKGPTAEHNLIALCRRHHRLKHRFSEQERLPRWVRQHLESTRSEVLAPVAERRQDGSLVWTMPTGRQYTVRARGPGMTEHADPLSRPPTRSGSGLRDRAATQPTSATGPEPPCDDNRSEPKLPQPRPSLEATLADVLARAGISPSSADSPRGEDPPGAADESRITREDDTSSGDDQNEPPF